MAGAVAHIAEECALGSIATPVTEHRNVASIGQAESQNVDGVGGGMFAERAFRFAVQPAAAVAAGMMDPSDPGSKMTSGRGLDDVALPKGQCRRDRAGGH